MTHGVVLYTDGSARPNPGNLGWGAHGYLYTHKEPGSNSKTHLKTHFITNTGYVVKGPSNVINTNECSEVEPVEYFDFLGSDGIGSNNESEINALYYSLTHIAEHHKDIESVRVFSDSEYVLKGLTEWVPVWIERDWKRRDGKPIANERNWKQLVSLINDIKENGIEFSIEWVQAHVGNLGNEIADQLAAIGVMHAGYNENFTDFRVTAADKYWVTSVVKHPFIHFKRLYFNSDGEYNKAGYYYVSEPGQDDHLNGKKHAETSYAVIRLYEPDHVIENVKERQVDIAQGINSIVMLYLDRLYSSPIYRSLNEYGKYALYQPSNSQFNLEHVSRIKITSERSPAGLIFRAIENFGFIESLLQAYEKHKRLEPPYELIDITDQFFEQKVSKKKTETLLKPSIKNDIKFIELQVPNPLSKQSLVKVSLRLGADILPRNNLKKIESLHPHIHLIMWPVSDQSLRYMCLVESDVGIGIWSNYHTDQIFLNS